MDGQQEGRTAQMEDDYDGPADDTERHPSNGEDGSGPQTAIIESDDDGGRGTTASAGPAEEDAKETKEAIEDSNEHRKAVPDQEQRSRKDQDAETTTGMLFRLKGMVGEALGTGWKTLLDQRSRRKRLVLVCAVVLLLVAAFGLGYYRFKPNAWRQRPAGVIRGDSTATAADISRHRVWPELEKGVRLCIPNNETEDAQLRSFFDDASVAHVDDVNHAMNRYLYFAIMNAVVLGSRFADDPAKAFAPGQKVGKDDVDKYLRLMLETMQGEQITTYQDASAQFNEMNRYLYLTIVQASVLRNKYPPSQQQNQTHTQTQNQMQTQTHTQTTETQTHRQTQTRTQTTDTQTWTQTIELDEARAETAKMQEQLREKDEETKRRLLEKDDEIKRKLREKDDEIKRLQDEVNRLRSGLEKCKETCEQRVAECHSQYKDCEAKHEGQGYDEDY